MAAQNHCKQSRLNLKIKLNLYKAVLNCTRPTFSRHKGQTIKPKKHQTCIYIWTCYDPSCSVSLTSSDVSDAVWQRHQKVSLLGDCTNPLERLSSPLDPNNGSLSLSPKNWPRALLHSNNTAQISNRIVAAQNHCKQSRLNLKIKLNLYKAVLNCTRPTFSRHKGQTKKPNKHQTCIYIWTCYDPNCSVSLTSSDVSDAVWQRHQKVSLLGDCTKPMERLSSPLDPNNGRLSLSLKNWPRVLLHSNNKTQISNRIVAAQNHYKQSRLNLKIKLNLYKVVLKLHQTNIL